MIGKNAQNTLCLGVVLFSLALFPIFASANVLTSEQYSLTPRGNGIGEGVILSSENYSMRTNPQTVQIPIPPPAEEDETEAETNDRSSQNRITTTPNPRLFPEFIIGSHQEQLTPQMGVAPMVPSRENTVGEQGQRTETVKVLNEINVHGEGGRSMRFTASAIGAWMSGHLARYLQSFEDIFISRGARVVVLSVFLCGFMLMRRTRWGRQYLPF